MGKSQRVKGRNGQSEFKKLLLERDWKVDSITAGIKSEDLIAEHPDGRRYSCEVKNHKLINMLSFLNQAREQAKVRDLPWMLAVRLPQHTGVWMVFRKDEPYYMEVVMTWRFAAAVLLVSGIIASVEGKSVEGAIFIACLCVVMAIKAK